MKKCISCGETKDEKEFYVRKLRSGNYGFRGRCKPCFLAVKKLLRDLWTPESKSRKYEVQKIWNAENRDRILELKKKDRAKHKERIKAHARRCNKEVRNHIVAARMVRGTNLKASEIPIELVKAKGMQILINRAIREIRK